MTQSTKGYIFAALAAASYGTNPIFALPLYHDGAFGNGQNADVTSVLLLRYALAVAILFAVMAMLGIIILGETLTLRPAIGMVMIFISVTVLVMQKKRKNKNLRTNKHRI